MPIEAMPALARIAACVNYGPHPQGWTAPQWILSIILAALLLMPIIVKAAGGVGWSRDPQIWLGRWLGQAFCVAVLIALLAWGGFY